MQALKDLKQENEGVRCVYVWGYFGIIPSESWTVRTGDFYPGPAEDGAWHRVPGAGHVEHGVVHTAAGGQGLQPAAGRDEVPHEVPPNALVHGLEQGGDAGGQEDGEHVLRGQLSLARTHTSVALAGRSRR